MKSDDEKQELTQQQSVTTHTLNPSTIHTPREDNEQQESSPVEHNDSYQSSSIFEPDWGKWRQQTKQELEDEWTVWTETNNDKTTQAYCHGRCHMCDKPVSTTSLKSNDDLTCFECKRSIIESEGEENINAKRVMEKQDKDDEEE